MLKIRLQRIGRRNDPAFRMVVAEHTIGPRSGRFLERVGTYNPKTKERSLNAERIKHWMSVGAQPSETVHNMLINEGLLTGAKVNVLPKKRPIVAEKSEDGAVPADASAANAEETPAAEASTDEGAEEIKEQSADETPVAEEKADAPAEEPAPEEESKTA